MILVFSDIHIHNSRRFGDPDARLGHFDKCLRLILKAAVNKKVDAVLFAGDLFEKHGVVSAQVLTLITKRFKQFEKTGIPFIAISGNHDMGNKSEYGSEVHTALAYLDMLITNFHLIDNTFIDIPGYRVTGVRYMSSRGSIEKQLKDVELSTDYPNILMMHNTPPNENTMIEPDIVVSNPDIQQFDIIFNGHIHKRQSDGKFHTVGNPIQKDATDAGQDKGFYLYDGNLTFISTNNYLPLIHVTEEDLDEELVIKVPPKIKTDDIKVIDFSDYNQMFDEYLDITDTGVLDKEILKATIKEFV